MLISCCDLRRWIRSEGPLSNSRTSSIGAGNINCGSIVSIMDTHLFTCGNCGHPSLRVANCGHPSLRPNCGPNCGHPSLREKAWTPASSPLFRKQNGANSGTNRGHLLPWKACPFVRNRRLGRMDGIRCRRSQSRFEFRGSAVQSIGGSRQWRNKSRPGDREPFKPSGADQLSKAAQIGNQPGRKTKPGFKV